MQELYLIIAPNYLPHVGGVERYTQSLARELVRQGKDVIIVTSSMKHVPDMETDEHGIPIYRIPTVYTIGDRMPIMLPSNRWRTLKKKCDQYSSVRVVIQTMLYPMCYFGLKFCKQNHFHYIVISHGANYVCLGNGMIDKMEHFYERWMLKKAHRMSAPFFAVSKAGADFLGQFGYQIKGILYNSIDYAYIEKIRIDTGYHVRTKYGIANDAAIFVFAGRLIPEKGVLQLVRAFSRLQKKYNTALLLVGDGPMLHPIRDMQIENVFCLGYQPHAETMRILKQCDCFCLPSDSEGFPCVIFEAILCRNYVISSPYGGAKEIITSNEYGCIMDGNTEDDIYHALEMYVSQRDQCNQAVERNVKRFFEFSTWEQTCENLICYMDEESNSTSHNFYFLYLSIKKLHICSIVADTQLIVCNVQIKYEVLHYCF